MTWVGVFVICVLMDFVWARYIAHTADGHAFKAAAWSVAVLVLSALSIIAYTENHWLMIPSGAGCFVGTYLATSRPLRKLGTALRQGSRWGGRAARQRNERP